MHACLSPFFPPQFCRFPLTRVHSLLLLNPATETKGSCIGLQGGKQTSSIPRSRRSCPPRCPQRYTRSSGMKRNNTSHSSKQTQHQTIQSDIHTRKQGRPQPMPLFVHVLPLFWLLLLCLTCLLPDCFVLALLSSVVYSPQHAHNQHITHHYSLSPKHIIATAAALHAGCLWPVHMQSTSSTINIKGVQEAEAT